MLSPHDSIVRGFPEVEWSLTFECEGVPSILLLGGA